MPLRRAQGKKITFLPFCTLYLRMDEDDRLNEALTYVGDPRFKSGPGERV